MPTASLGAASSSQPDDYFELVGSGPNASQIEQSGGLTSSCCKAGIPARRSSASRRNWRHIDASAAPRHEEFESGVIHVLRRAAGEKGRDCLIGLSVPTDKVVACTQRDPVEIYSKPS